MRPQRPLEWWIGVIRLGAIPFAVLQVSLTAGIPSRDRPVAYAATVLLAIGAVLLFSLSRGDDVPLLTPLAMAFDFLILSSFVLLFAFEPGTPTRELLLIAILAGAVRYGMRGGVLTAVAAIPVAVWFEQRRASTVHSHFRYDFFIFQAFSGLVMALLVGWLVNRVALERRNVQRRVEEAEALRDELGRRADLLDAANRCARALSSSLDLDEASGAFVRELRGLVPFERMAIVLEDEGTARVIATAGAFADEVMPPGTVLTLDRNLLAHVVETGETVVRPDLEHSEYAEEARLRALGIHSRVAAPLNVGGRTIGLISVGRGERDAFSEHEIELMSLLGSLVASAVQNIRAYESERRTVEELQRLSMMRADFVSLVSHELRSPMAAVIGASRTLQQRWRELSFDQREAFLALIGDETTRLATLIGDVLDTSRIEAGTFSYRFSDVDLAALVRDSIATAAVGQDEVPLNATVREVPLVRGDPGRLRQIVSNLIDNAVKYSPTGTPVDVDVRQLNGAVVVVVSDHGLGISADDQQLIFEKFGRASGGSSKPGTGLGLYIARSIAEAHGGTVEVSSEPGHGATFTLSVPLVEGV
jgi:signal transduction histidine kinase